MPSPGTGAAPDVVTAPSNVAPAVVGLIYTENGWERYVIDAGNLRIEAGSAAHDIDGDSSWCHHCGALLIKRDWYQLIDWQLDARGCCKACGTRCAGVFEARPGDWGAKRQPVRLANYA